MHQDELLISRLGGPTKVAMRLGYDLKKGGVQRVQNWRIRGIPPSVELANEWITQERLAIKCSSTAPKEA